MAATFLVAEVLIAGLGALVWILIFAASYFGLPPLWQTFQNGIEGLKGFGSFAVVIVLAVAYVLGLVTDRCADYILSIKRIEGFLTDVTKGIAARDVADRRIEILVAEGRASSFLDYVRGHVRIFRSAAFNLALIGLSSAILLWSLGWQYAAGAAVATAPAVVFVLVLYGASLSTYQQELRKALVAQERLGRGRGGETQKGGRKETRPLSPS